MGARRKVNKEMGNIEVGGVRGGNDNEEDAIANGSGMIESQRVAGRMMAEEAVEGMEMMDGLCHGQRMGAA